MVLYKEFFTMGNYYLSKGMQRALTIAREEAVRLQHESIGLEHFLLGILSAEDEMNEYVLQKKKLLTRSLQLMINDFSPKRPFLPEYLAYSSAVDRIFDFAINEGIQRNLTRIDVNAVLLGFANDPSGMQLLEKLNVSPGKIRESARDHLQRSQDGVESISSNQAAAQSSSKKGFFSEHGTGIKRLLDHFPCSPYILASASPPFYLCKTDYGMEGGPEEINLTHIGFEFAHPKCDARFEPTQPVQRIRVENWKDKRLGDLRLWLTLNRIDMALSDDPQHLPEMFRMLFDKNQADLSRGRQILNTVTWTAHSGSGLSFNAAHWDNAQIPVGWAYSKNEGPFLVIVTLGISYDNFLESLDSLVILRSNDNALINKLQEELK
jgi:hypothetical protein